MVRKKVFHNSDSDSDNLEDEPIRAESEVDESAGDDDSGSDAPPDDISFTSSKQKSLQKVRDALNQIGSEKEKLKKKRRLRNERFTEQKVL